MDAFNFAFSLFAIVLGLSLVEVLTGFARALKRRRVVHLGWLTPMAAIFVMLDLTSFWEFELGLAPVRLSAIRISADRPHSSAPFIILPPPSSSRANSASAPTSTPITCSTAGKCSAPSRFAT